MDTNPDSEGAILYKEEVFQIVGCAIEVLNTLGHGIAERTDAELSTNQQALRGPHLELQEAQARMGTDHPLAPPSVQSVLCFLIVTLPIRVDSCSFVVKSRLKPLFQVIL
jgi:hypothetical protein